MPKHKIVRALSAYPHCLTYTSKIENGFYYSIDLTDNGNLVRHLIFLDTKNAIEEEEKTYSQIMTKNQLNFYENELFNTNFPSTVFTHVGLPAYFHAANLLQNGEDSSIVYHYGNRIQGDYSHLMEKDSFFEKIKTLNSTDSVFFGHYHGNDLSISYQGVRMTSVQHSGFSHSYRVDVWEEDSKTVLDFRDIIKYGDKRGGVLYCVETNGKYTQTPVYGNEILPDYKTKFAIDYAYYEKLYSQNLDYKILH